MDRLYVIVREDLVPAQQAVQAMHAQRQFAAEHTEVERAWYESSNTLALLAVPSITELDALCDEARLHGFLSSAFREQDLGYTVTAITLEPRAKKLVRALPRALGGR